MKNNKIPKGAKVYVNGILKATLLKELKKNDLINSNHFEPELPKGTPLTSIEFKVNNKLIYKHPLFY